MAKKRLWDKGDEVDPVIHAFTVGTDPEVDLDIARWDVLASAAHAKMLARIGILSAEEEKNIVAELKNIAARVAEGTFVIPPELEDCHTAIEAILTKKLGEAGKKIHTGRSRNDQVLVAMRLAMRHAVVETGEDLLLFARILAARSGEIGQTVFPGYTHLQPAMPTTVGVWLRAFSEAALELVETGNDLYRSLGKNPLGAGSGFGVPLPLDRMHTAELLGFHSVQRNPIAVQNSRGQYELRVLRWASDIASMIEKAAWDCILYSTQEFGFFKIAPAFTTGSSIMPQKRNPDVLELLRAKAAASRSAEDEVRWLVAKLPSNYHRDFQLTKEPVFRSIREVRECLAIFARVAATLRVDAARIAQAMTDDLFATHAVYAEVAKGKAFRDAYAEVGKKVREGKLETAGIREEVSRGLGEGTEEERELLEAMGELERRNLELRREIDEIEKRVFV
jgi:argininosuccinate lyase